MMFEKLMKDKRGFETRDFVIAGLIFSAVVAFFVIGIAGIQSNYPDNPNIISESFSDNYDTLTTQTAKIETMRETALGDEGLSFRGAFDVTFGSFFTVMQLVFSTLSLLGNMYVNFIVDFTFIDSTSVVLLFTVGLAVLTTFLIFKLINAVGRNPV